MNNYLAQNHVAFLDHPRGAFSGAGITVAHLDGFNTLSARAIDGELDFVLEVLEQLATKGSMLLWHNIGVEGEADSEYPGVGSRRNARQVPEVLPPGSSEVAPEQWFVSNCMEVSRGKCLFVQAEGW
jgi:hypothetical protein